MMDIENDDLLLATFIESCENYIHKMNSFGRETPSYALSFLKENHIHVKCMSYFLNPTEYDGSGLMGSSTLYLQAYCELHAEDLLQDKDLCRRIMDRLTYVFRSTSRAQWKVALELGGPLSVHG